MTDTGEPNTVPQSCRGHLVRPLLYSAGAVLLGGLLLTATARAVEFGSGGVQGSVDTTISHGMTFRVEERNEELAEDTNGNDGNLNYDRGIVANTSKFTTDLDLEAGNFGAFVRVTGFYDHENEDGGRARTPLSDAALEGVGSDVEVLDAYITAGFDAGDTAVDLRIGKHVLNWGESTFIPNGINAINPFDVSKLRLPGSELREALLPVNMASVSVAPTDNLSVAGFYQLDWAETRIDPVGSYFSTVDYAGPGARKAVITDITDGRDDGHPFGPLATLIDLDLAAAMVPAAAISSDKDFGSVLRGPDRSPRDSGQWGVEARYFSEELNDTEFGLYFINHHSRLPTIGARTAMLNDIMTGLTVVETSQAAAGSENSVLRKGLTAQIRNGLQPAVEAGQMTNEAANAGAAAAAEEQARTLVTQIAPALAINQYAKGGYYFLEYPEDIQLYGLSFNTVLGTSGWALQGEYSFRNDAPFQIAERRVIEDGLRPMIGALTLAGPAAAAAATAQAAAQDAAAALAAAQGDTAAPALDVAALGQEAMEAADAARKAAAVALEAGKRYSDFLGAHRPSDVDSYVRRDVSQVQATVTQVFGPTLGADGLVFVAEAAVMHVHDMPDKDDTPLESPAGGILASGAADADATSWGYRVAARLDYNNAVAGINLFPYAQFLHDVSGNSPSPSGPFVEGRTALTLGLRADYLSSWQADLSYTRYAGDGNELADRDFVSVSFKYSF